MSNFIPNKVITVNGKEPKWINNYIKIKIKGKNDAYLKRMLQNPQSCNISPIQLSKLVNGIEESINKYFKYLQTNYRILQFQSNHTGLCCGLFL